MFVLLRGGNESTDDVLWLPFTKTFDECIVLAVKAFERHDYDGAFDYCSKAVASSDDGLQRIENVAWQVVQNRKCSIWDLHYLTMLSVFLTQKYPESCVGHIADAKISIIRHVSNDFQQAIQLADSQICKLSPVYQIALSIDIYELHKEHQRMLHETTLVNSSEAVQQVYGNLKVISDYAGTVLDRIEEVFRKMEVPPVVWQRYLSICEEWPLHKHRAEVARMRLAAPSQNLKDWGPDFRT